MPWRFACGTDLQNHARRKLDRRRAVGYTPEFCDVIFLKTIHPRRTTAKIQSKARVTRAHFGKQRLIQRNIGRHEPSAQLIAISLAHATAKPVSPSMVGPSISPGASRVTKMVDDTPIHRGSSHKRKLDLFQALDEGNRKHFFSLNSHLQARCHD